ncbi:HNH endonuclease signature motif containing protein [Abditibacterium utsteinense]|nr:HNH endonuclease signature motif containing protein [Abditibacterium utsteinense]
MSFSQKGEKNLRLLYIERFSVEQVERACRKANWHRARALKLGRDLHFLWWQWLDLCESQSWNCAYCHKNEALEPHHVWELHRGGGNGIENIEALCRICHAHIHEWPDDVSDAWMEFQSALLRQFQSLALRGQSVRLCCGTHEQNQTRRRGVLMEFIAPQRGLVPLRGISPNGKRGIAEPFVSAHPLSADWWENRARAKVQWHAGGMWEEVVPLAHLAPREREVIIPRQSEPKMARAVQFSLGF